MARTGVPKELKDDELAWLREVGMRVRLARVRRRLTQREAAAAAGISAVTFSSVERADHVAGVLSYIWIARALGLSLSELLDGAPLWTRSRRRRSGARSVSGYDCCGWSGN